MTHNDRDSLPLTELVAPADEAAVAEAVRAVAEQGTPLYPIGGGTSLDYGVRPVEPGLGLSLGRLGRLVDYPARDLTITVEAGTTMAALSKRLAAEGQRLPVDVPHPDRATIGGVVAAGLPGPRQYGRGTIRDYVIGLRAVDGLGTTFSAGGRVVKNAAGYDLCRLLGGSLGTLGVLVQVTLMVKPMPEASALVACSLPEWETAERLLSALIQTRTLPVAVELLGGPAWQNDPALGPLPEPCVGWLVVGLEGSFAEVDWMIGQLREEWRQAGIDAPLALRGNRADPLWERLSEFPSPGHDEGREEFSIQANVLPGDTVGVISRLVRADPAGSILAHAGNGMIVARLALEPGRLAALLQSELRPHLCPLGGTAVVLSQPPGARLERETVWGPPRPAQALMQSIKDQFDPKNILNRGRFVFPSKCP